MKPYYHVTLRVIYRKPMPGGYWLDEPLSGFPLRFFDSDSKEQALNFTEGCAMILRGLSMMFPKSKPKL